MVLAPALHDDYALFSDRLFYAVVLTPVVVGLSLLAFVLSDESGWPAVASTALAVAVVAYWVVPAAIGGDESPAESVEQQVEARFVDTSADCTGRGDRWRCNLYDTRRDRGFRECAVRLSRDGLLLTPVEEACRP